MRIKVNVLRYQKMGVAELGNELCLFTILYYSLNTYLDVKLNFSKQPKIYNSYFDSATPKNES